MAKKTGSKKTAMRTKEVCAMKSVIVCTSECAACKIQLPVFQDADNEHSDESFVKLLANDYY